MTVLTFEPEDGRINQVLTAYVRIDTSFVTAVARALLMPFGGLADRKLSKGVVTAARMAEWAASSSYGREIDMPRDTRPAIG